jgi:ribokinase
MDSNRLDFLAVGDIVTEPFIKLKDAEVHCAINNEACTICMRFGDKIPYASAEVIPAVGNASNAAVAAARLGVSTALVTDIGNDSVGEGNTARLQEEGVDTGYVRVHEGMQSNYHYVLWYNDDRTILVKHEEYPYEFPTTIPGPHWLYLSSLADHSLPYHEQIEAYLAAHPETKFAFQPGTFQMKLGTDTLKGLYARSALFFCNKEEAERILALPAGTDSKQLLTSLRERGPEVVVITDGTIGAYAYDGTDMFKVPMYPDQEPPFERTGAGDAFAATVTVALALGKPLQEALLWGPINSMSVVQQVGAQKGLLSREALEKFLTDAPASYRVEPL